MKTYSTDILIIGAGPAGSASAALLLQHGIKDILVVEKEQFPRFVIGESLLPHCMDILQDAALLDVVKKQNFLEKNGAVFFKKDETLTFEFNAQFTKGWEFTYQVPRADFDQTLADEVSKRGVPILYEHQVCEIIFETKVIRVMVKDNCGDFCLIQARYIIDASGYGRVLPRLLNLDKPSHFTPKQALFTHVKNDKRSAGKDEGKIWICIHDRDDRAWMWIIPFSNGLTSFGIVAHPEFYKQFEGSLELQLRTILEADRNVVKRLGDSIFTFNPKTIFGYSTNVSRLWGDRFVLLGNAAEFLDPIFSSGVTIALECAKRATDLIVRQRHGRKVDWQIEYEDTIRQGVNTFKAFVEKWYDTSLQNIFFSKNRNDLIQKQICSVLAGYAWDQTNPFVLNPNKHLDQILHFLN